jgi:hypothetical protein
MYCTRIDRGADPLVCAGPPDPLFRSKTKTSTNRGGPARALLGRLFAHHKPNTAYRVQKLFRELIVDLTP